MNKSVAATKVQIFSVLEDNLQRKKDQMLNNFCRLYRNINLFAAKLIKLF